MNCDRAEFWVQIHNVSLMFMLVDVRRFLGSIVGKVVDIDRGENSYYMVKFLRTTLSMSED